MRRAAALLALAAGFGSAAGVAVAGKAPRAVLSDTGSGHLPAYRGAENPPLVAAVAAGTPVLTAPATIPPATTTTPPPTTTTTTGPAPQVALGVQETETPGYATTLSRTSVPAGDVTVQLQNTGEDPHNLIVVRTSDNAVVARFEDVEPGAVATKSVRFAAGSYRLSCTLTAPVSHDMAGMNARLTVSSG